MADFSLHRGHGFYELRPHTPAAVEFVAGLPPVMVAADGRVLLDSFFANAGDWCAIHLLPRLSVEAFGDVYEGESGKKALWEFCA